MRRLALAGAVAGLGLALLWGLRRGDEHAAPQAPGAAAPARPAPGGSPTPVRPVPEGRGSVGRGSAPPGAAEPRVPSLAGTEVDGALLADADGRFLVTPSALRLFDHFLSGSGELDPGRLRALIEAEIERQLPPSARADARALLDAHLAYREAARRLHAEGLAAEDLETRHQRLRELRREVFGAADAERLFGEEEQNARVALAVRRLEQDPALSPEERAARREALWETLPESVREARRQAVLPLALSRAEAALRAEGASPGEIRELREAWVGREAAERLEALEARRAHWNQRLEAYRLERDLLLSGPEAGSAEALEQLRARHFPPEDLARVRALDRIDAGADP